MELWIRSPFRLNEQTELFIGSGGRALGARWGGVIVGLAGVVTYVGWSGWAVLALCPAKRKASLWHRLRMDTLQNHQQSLLNCFLNVNQNCFEE